MAENKELSNLTEVYEDLLNLGYVGAVKNMEEFRSALNHGPPNHRFLDVTAWLSIQLANLLKMHNRFTVDSEGNLKSEIIGSHPFKTSLTPSHPFYRPQADPLAFFVQLDALLEVLACPLKEIMSGSISQKLLLFENKICTIEYLIQELRAAKIVAAFGHKVDKPFEVMQDESKAAKELKQMLIGLNFSRPPYNIEASVIFREVEKRVCALSQPLLPDERVGEILFSGVLTESQWFSLEKLYAEFFEEYRNRREMDITRVSVTISSFLWKDAVKKSQNVTTIFDTFRENVTDEPDVDMSDIIAATNEFVFGEKVSSAAVCKNTHSAVYQVKIGDVPDRGGRPNEQAPPPPEIPSWQPRSDSRARGRPPFSASRGRLVTPDRGTYIQAGADPRNNFSRPMEVVAPVAGDNFAQFGHVIMEQHPLQGAQLIINQGVQLAPPNIPNPGWSVPPGHTQFGWQEAHGVSHAFSGQGAYGGPNDFSGQGAYGGPNDFSGQGAYGGPNDFIGQGAFGGPNDFTVPVLPVSSSLYHIPGARFQRGHGARGGYGRGGRGRGNPGGFGGFGHQGGY